MGKQHSCDVCDATDIDVAEVIKRYDVGYGNNQRQQMTKAYLCAECSYNLQLFIDEIGGEQYEQNNQIN
jgi:hypothetical protein